MYASISTCITNKSAELSNSASNSLLQEEIGKCWTQVHNSKRRRGGRRRGGEKGGEEEGGEKGEECITLKERYTYIRWEGSRGGENKPRKEVVNGSQGGWGT